MEVEVAAYHKPVELRYSRQLPLPLNHFHFPKLRIYSPQAVKPRGRAPTEAGTGRALLGASEGLTARLGLLASPSPAVRPVL